MTRPSLLFLATTACWGEGPTPEAPTGVEIVYSVPQQNDAGDCALKDYIGDVSIENDVLNVVFHKWNRCGNSSNYTVQGIRKRLTDGDQLSFEAGISKGYANARVGGDGSRSVWASSTDMNQTVVIGGEPTLDLSVSYSGQNPSGFYLPSGIVVDDTYGFFTGTSTGGIDFNHPEWPCCGTDPTTTKFGKAWRVEWSAAAPVVTELPVDDREVYFQSLKTGIVANTSKIFFTSRTDDTAQNVIIKSMVKETTPPVAGQELATIVRPSMLVGFDVNATDLYWAETPSYVRDPVPGPGCKITKVSVDGGAPEVAFNTSDFFCSDLALDASHAYFTIVSVPDDPDDGGSDPRARGIGLGRISLTGATNVETVRTGIDRDHSGARRVYVDGDNLYAVDPDVIVRIDKTKFAGKHDF